MKMIQKTRVKLVNKDDFIINSKKIECDCGGLWGQMALDRTLEALIEQFNYK